MGNGHTVPEAVRQDMVGQLRRREEEAFIQRREKRFHSVGGWLWQLYYAAFGDLEQRLYHDTVEWQVSNRYQRWRPVFLHYLQWPQSSLPMAIFSLALTGCFLVPPVTAAAILFSQDPQQKWHSSENVSALIWIAILVRISPVIISAYTILIVLEQS